MLVHGVAAQGRVSIVVGCGLFRGIPCEGKSCSSLPVVRLLFVVYCMQSWHPLLCNCCNFSCTDCSAAVCTARWETWGGQIVLDVMSDSYAMLTCRLLLLTWQEKQSVRCQLRDTRSCIWWDLRDSLHSLLQEKPAALLEIHVLFVWMSIRSVRSLLLCNVLHIPNTYLLLNVGITCFTLQAQFSQELCGSMADHQTNVPSL